ncbi:polysaccharide deacetylase family protein, partial [bacterium]|nr:polysaccharide deacetylase family protein [bacterium]
MIIEQPAKFLRWLYPHALWRMNPEERAVYLTFDDGPIPEVTPWVLEVLAHYDIKATFFMVGDNIRK